MGCRYRECNRILYQLSRKIQPSSEPHGAGQETGWDIPRPSPRESFKSLACYMTSEESDRPSSLSVFSTAGRTAGSTQKRCYGTVSEYLRHGRNKKWGRREKQGVI